MQNPEKYVECDTDHMSYMLPFFCGSEEVCQTATEESFRRAKRNMEQKFLIVGLTEQIDDLFPVLEKMFPSYFKGITTHWEQQGELL